MSSIDPLQWTVIFGGILCFFQAFTIGAKDFAVSWTTIIAPKSISYKHAVIAGMISEFLGAVGLGPTITDSIREHVMHLEYFSENPALLQLGMISAMISSIAWLHFSIHYRLAVSASHSLVGSFAGVAIASYGTKAVNWTWSGMGRAIAGIFIAPTVSGLFSTILFLFTVYWVNSGSIGKSFISVPFYFMMTAALLTLFIILEGGRTEEVRMYSDYVIINIVICVASIIGVFTTVFFVPFVRRKIIKEEKLKWYHVFYIWLVPDREKDGRLSKRLSRLYDHNGEVRRSYAAPGVSRNMPVTAPTYVSAEGNITNNSTGIDSSVRATSFFGGNNNADSVSDAGNLSEVACRHIDEKLERREGAPSNATDKELEKNLIEAEIRARKKLATDAQDPESQKKRKKKRSDKPFLEFLVQDILLHGLNQSMNTRKTEEIIERNALAIKLPQKVEFLYSFIQIATGYVSSFVHGSYDISDAVAPLSVILHIQYLNQVPGEKVGVSTWELVLGGFGIVLGIFFYGYRQVQTLGNQFTYHSPIRGFCIQLGVIMAAITSRYVGFFASSTHFYVGSIVGVALCNRNLKSVDWHHLKWIVVSWLVTIPVTGLLAAGIFSCFKAGYGMQRKNEQR